MSIKELENVYMRISTELWSAESKQYNLHDIGGNPGESQPSSAHKHFKESIKDYILNQAEKSPDVFNSRLFLDIVEQARGEEYVANMVRRHSLSINSVEDGKRWLEDAKKYLTLSDKKRIAEQSAKLPVRSLLEGVMFLRMGRQYLPKGDIVKVEKRIANVPISDLSEVMVSIRGGHSFLPEEIIYKIVNNIPIKTAGDGWKVLNELREYLSMKSIAKIIDKTPIKTAEDGALLLKPMKGYEQRALVIKKTLPLIKTNKELKKLNLTYREYWKARKQIKQQRNNYIRNSKKTFVKSERLRCLEEQLSGAF